MTLKNNQTGNEIATVDNNCEGTANQDSQSAYSDELDECNSEFKKTFSMLKSEEKWYLSNEKCIDNELFIFGLQCESDHPIVVSVWVDTTIS